MNATHALPKNTDEAVQYAQLVYPDLKDIAPTFPHDQGGEFYTMFFGNEVMRIGRYGAIDDRMEQEVK